MAAKPKKPHCPVVAVLNMKGGVGKTTISAHVFRHLYSHLRKRVLLVDFDPQFNLTQAVLTEKKYESQKAVRRTIFSVMEDPNPTSIFKVTSKVGSPPSLDQVSVKLRQFQNTTPEINLLLVPGDFDLVKYSMIEDINVLTPIKNRFRQFIEGCRQERDLVCIDCNPSSSFLTMCALQVATHVLVPVRPDRYSMLGLRMLNRYIADLPSLSRKPALVVLLNGVKSSGYDPTVENALRSDPDFGPATLANSLHISRVLEASPSYTGFATDKRGQGWRVTPRITAIVMELKSALGMT
ncbi:MULTISPECIES: ParA family protein [unclassified Synechococcus]|uniref:ParA family protein n=1 Tax=unclassified Synechococcus TaxID=2626047 RepID=UPI001C23C850|nr:MULTISPECIES: ParA family protein [unclassified Synechococcus]